MVDHACVALSRIADSFARSPAQLQVLCEHGLIQNAMQLVRASHPASDRLTPGCQVYINCCSSNAALMLHLLLRRDLRL